MPRRTLIALATLVACSLAPARAQAPLDRIAAQVALERLAHGYRLGAPAFDPAAARAAAAAKVARTAALSRALAAHGTAVTAEALARELARIERGTRFPARLLAAYAALGRDPVLVQEALVRPVLVERLARNAGLEAEGAADAPALPVVARADVALGAALDAARARPDATDPGCVPDDTWDNGVLGAQPDAKTSFAAVWTGGEMIVWGGYAASGSTRTGWRYDPALDAWTRIAQQDAPSGRGSVTAVWTGTEMIVWGGSGFAGETASGGRYNPATDTWTPTSLAGAPAPRARHTAVWTGSRMLVWGGADNIDSFVAVFGDGAAYDPATDTWLPLALTGAPEPRADHTAVWTGRKMIVWGGIGDANVYLGDGAAYDPATNAWTPLSEEGRPQPRSAHTAAWTGSEMIIWSGVFDGNQFLFDGFLYDPAADAWRPMADSPTARTGQASTWIGDRLFVWGGQSQLGSPADGYLYDPQADAWSPVPATGAPSPRYFAAAFWTGSRVIVWGGTFDGASLDSGGQYDPATSSWTPTYLAPLPPPRHDHTLTWTGAEAIVVGGRRIGVQTAQIYADAWSYDPVTDAWTALPTTGGPGPRYGHSATWTGAQMVVWSGLTNNDLRLPGGRRFDPVSRTWTPMTTSGAPAGRTNHTAVWSGSEVWVWGGLVSSALQETQTGGRYNPATDRWTALPTGGAPSPRFDHSAVWTGSAMVIWGGVARTPTSEEDFGDGAQFSVTANGWLPLTSTGAPAARYGNATAWDGARMIVWGGAAQNGTLSDGGAYDPAADAWAPIAGAPVGGRRYPAYAWTGSELVVWGGESTSGWEDTGARYRPATDSWVRMSERDAPQARAAPAAWTGDVLLVWGGVTDLQTLATGGRYAIGNSDLDGDGRADACDCAPADPGAFALPQEVARLRFDADRTTLRWDPVSPSAGAGAVYDVPRGGIDAGPPAGGTCLASGTPLVQASDPSRPGAGAGSWYLVCARNACGDGTYGTRSDGTPRAITACP